ncbi:hypothetical protein MBLNU230_g1957t1 [Neophaeotheca triangularis]
MAALLVAAGVAIAQKVSDKKQAKRDKITLDEKRYRNLERETRTRLERTASGRVVGREGGSGSGSESESDDGEVLDSEERKLREKRRRERRERRVWEGYENRDAGRGREKEGEKEGLGKAGKGRNDEGGRDEKVADQDPPGYGEVVGEDKEKAWGSRNPFRKGSSHGKSGDGGAGGGMNLGAEQAPEIKGFVGNT